ncbi:MAG: signal transduction protein, partial [Lachnospiraceae bacterium]|nr:signal transduction protein [Lachnospiraceae bacterium]
FQWSVNPGVRHVSSSFYVSAGQTITVSATALPGGNTYRIGIQDSWNNVRYVEGTGSLGHQFAITSSGNYRVLVQNRSSVTLTATGAYSYY